MESFVIYIYWLIIGLLDGQFRLSEKLMYEKKFAKVTFAESRQWPVYNCLLCNKKDSCRLQLFYPVMLIVARLLS